MLVHPPTTPGAQTGFNHREEKLGDEGLRSLGFKPGLRIEAKGSSQNRDMQGHQGNQIPLACIRAHIILSAYYSLEWGQVCMGRGS